MSDARLDNPKIMNTFKITKYDKINKTKQRHKSKNKLMLCWHELNQITHKFGL